ncbi:MAG: hypothetical protein ACI9XC_001962 [Gammaproteobacteria bacterium]|jgi:hypothetical protein
MKRFLFALLAMGIGNNVVAHQPIMDMAPRWNNGYGVQTRIELANSKTTTWIEGVYTFKPSVRMTLKLPYEDEKIGDAIFAVPFKQYTNNKGFTSNWSLTPSVRVPTGGGNDWDPGLSLSYSSETVNVYQLYDLYTLGDKTGLDINVGLVHANGRGSSWFTLWDVSALDSDSGQRVLTGPVLVYFKRNIVLRAEYKFVARDNDVAWKGDYLSFSIGVVY